MFFFFFFEGVAVFKSLEALAEQWADEWTYTNIKKGYQSRLMSTVLAMFPHSLLYSQYKYENNGILIFLGKVY